MEMVQSFQSDSVDLGTRVITARVLLHFLFCFLRIGEFGLDEFPQPATRVLMVSATQFNERTPICNV